MYVRNKRLVCMKDYKCDPNLTPPPPPLKNLPIFFEKAAYIPPSFPPSL